MKLSSESFQPGSRIADRYAFAKKDEKSHVALADNHNPQFSWTDAPSATRSFILICHDADAPSRADHVNKEGITVPAALMRVDFAHWVLVDIDANTRSIAEGEYSMSVTPHGKPGPAGPNGTRQGLNNYTQWFESDEDMAGGYFGYDGPCPPWNDELIHHYYFTLYALDVQHCAVDGKFTRDDVLKAMRGHVLAQAVMTTTYTLNPKLRMIERYVFVKLKPEYATDASRAEITARSKQLANVPGVRGVVVGTPADTGARHAWDLSLVVRFDTLADVERYLDHPEHEAYYEGFLEPRLQVIKAWNFGV